MILFVVFAAGLFMEVENALNLVDLKIDENTNFTVPNYGDYNPLTYS